MTTAHELEAELLAAHGANDQQRLIPLYAQAAEMAFEGGEIDRACFYLTHAYVFALEEAHPALPDLADQLLAHGRI